MSTLAEDLRTLSFKKRAASKMRKVADAIAADAKSYELQCYDRMEAEDALDDNGGGTQRNKFGTFTASQTILASINDREAFEAWAAEQDETYFEEKAREGIINQLARELLDNGQPLPPGLTVYPQRRVTVKGARGK